MTPGERSLGCAIRQPAAATVGAQTPEPAFQLIHGFPGPVDIPGVGQGLEAAAHSGDLSRAHGFAAASKRRRGRGQDFSIAVKQGPAHAGNELVAGGEKATDQTVDHKRLGGAGHPDRGWCARGGEFGRALGFRVAEFLGPSLKDLAECFLLYGF